MPRAAETAGFENKRKRKRELEAVSENDPAADSGKSKFARALGSPDWTTREKGLQVLTRWLTHRPYITDAELNKIWKGLFYSFWHADKQPVQETLAERLAQILPQLSEEVAFAYFRVYFTSMRREWFGVDRLRLDKFMMLTRKFVQQTFVHLRAADWDQGRVEPYMDFLADDVLAADGGPPALGLVYHLADCYVPELLASDADERIPPDALPLLLSPWTRLLAEIQHSAGIARVTKGAFEPLLAACEPGGGAPSCSFAQAELLAGLAQTCFEMGAAAEVRAKNREALYQLSKRFKKAAKRLPAATADGPASAPVPPEPHAVPAAAAPPQPASHAPAVAPPALGNKKSAKKALSRLAQSTTAEAPAEALAAAAASPLEADAAVPPAVATKRTKQKKKCKASVGTAVPAPGSSPAVPNAAASAGAAAAATRTERALTRSGTAAAAAAPAQPHGTPTTAPEAGRDAATLAGRHANGCPSSDSKKSVHFRMKNNLFFEPHGPVPSPEIRTPPNARPKGPALRVQPATDPGKAEMPLQKRRKTELLNPKSMFRSKAAAFF